MMKELMIGVASLVSLMGVTAEARTTVKLGNSIVEIANSATALESGDLALMEQHRKALEPIHRVAALPIETVASLPDARDVGYGDCKTLAKTFRTMMANEGFVPDSMLIALVTTEKGDPHAVLVIRAIKNEKVVSYVYDIRVLRIETLDESLRRGYKYEAIEAYPEGQFLGWNGKEYL
ncbi:MULTISPECIES: transglutaminase-like cysteine peptidase [unclassified Sphingopyxis]|uniref:transglutaminase-like cysteine peptidase n=1 Tax=unclassified Sphingopyxis TaxID=2614943 RepID=UPI0007319DE5|nr:MULTISPECIES: transglutaminase-like cysteine peptidase [unclassified Sphingopyxis]KTE27408.1 hypothetical protein ATE61_05545 [Sphingopyxis sp. H057]KTE54711.1 hypothetical protein ATE64_05540 [Sphingopyxis sp. H073]KTE57037.1 hypothetical protein ATE69_05525 [Sphingopyxis sp. H071]KTE60114.1 hypothetical protein ATE66_09545 [Sphingopyxis sp. H107]KTE67599.1 hypothetical protein ATE60_19210 [Sphingopyxis sp. H081]